MIIDNTNINITDDEWIKIILEYLNGWTNRRMSMSTGYDEEDIRFYDGLIGTLIRQTEECFNLYPDMLDEEFVNSWKYQGKIYRALHKSTNYKSSSRYCLRKVKYNRMITHWTKDYTFSALDKLNRDEECIILEAETGKHFGFDINLFRDKYGTENVYTKNEQEVIFPMYKECIKEYKMSINEFIIMKNS